MNVVTETFPFRNLYVLGASWARKLHYYFLMSTWTPVEIILLVCKNSFESVSKTVLQTIWDNRGRIQAPDFQTNSNCSHITATKGHITVNVIMVPFLFPYSQWKRMT